MIRATVLALVLLAPGLAAAQQRQQQQARQDDLGTQVERNMRTCMGNSQDTGLARSCMEGQRAAIAPRLQRAVERLLETQTDPARRAAMSEVQAAWATYRDRRCDFAGTNPERGADAAADRAACYLQFDVGRTVEIERLLDPPPAPQQQRQQQRR
jgi:uncharacterized protein YecT (DUF1311 family)